MIPVTLPSKSEPGLLRLNVSVHRKRESFFSCSFLGPWWRKMGHREKNENKIINIRTSHTHGMYPGGNECPCNRWLRTTA